MVVRVMNNEFKRMLKIAIVAQFAILYPAFSSRNWGNLWETSVKRAYPRVEHGTSRIRSTTTNSTPSFDENRYLIRDDDRSIKKTEVEMETVNQLKFSFDYSSLNLFSRDSVRREFVMVFLKRKGFHLSRAVLFVCLVHVSVFICIFFSSCF
jgi:hypothetical protein